MAECAVEIELYVRGPGVAVANVSNNHRMSRLGLLADGSMSFPQYSLTNTDEPDCLLIRFKRDLWNSFGKDVSADDAC